MTPSQGVGLTTVTMPPTLTDRVSESNLVDPG
jgi:hypothetical protein